jgi:hypothetical protein
MQCTTTPSDDAYYYYYSPATFVDTTSNTSHVMTITNVGNVGIATTAGWSNVIVFPENQTSGTATTTTTTATTTITGTSASSSMIIIREPRKLLLSQYIKQNLLIKSSSRYLSSKISMEEQKARDSLRDLITEKDWRRYVTNGFIMVKGEHYWYQIFNDQRRIRVYHKGKHTHSICIHTDAACPPTDHVLNMKLLVELDEMRIWHEGRVSRITADSSFAERMWNTPHISLLEYARKLA